MSDPFSPARMVWARRCAQTASLLLFVYLFLEAARYPINRANANAKFFFLLDPLAMLSVWLAAHAIAAGMLLSVVTLAVTLLAGRWFCGWVCPMGTLMNVFASLRKRVRKDLIASGGYSRLHRLKYYGLAAFLCAALAGVNVAGWLDPIAFLFRSFTTAVYPVFNDVTASLFGWVYDANPAAGPLRLTAVTEPVYEFLRLHVMGLRQPQFFGGFVIGILFAAVLAANLFRARFWCRYICPLGALLGVAGKNPLVRLRTGDACNHCRICLTDCQGGARSADGAGWKPAECLYCFNCVAECPSKTVSLGFERTPPDVRVSDGAGVRE